MAKLARIARRDRGAVGELRAASLRTRQRHRGSSSLLPRSGGEGGAKGRGGGFRFEVDQPHPTGLRPATLPTASRREGGIRKNELRSELCSSEPHAEEAQSPSRSMWPGRLRN